MTEVSENAGQRDRSPAYPNITLKAALDRLTEFDTHFKRSPARAEKVGDAWGIKGKAYVDRTAAALRYFGLIEYQGVGKDRQIVVSEEGRKYLRAQQEETKLEVVKAAALRPKQIAKFWEQWGTNRPADAACLDDLIFKNGFSDKGANEFLRIYDATITYAGLLDSDSLPQRKEGVTMIAPTHDRTPGPHDHFVNAVLGSRNVPNPLPPEPPNPTGNQIKVTMDGDRLQISANVDAKGAQRLLKAIQANLELLGDDEDLSQFMK